jgi:DNA-binding NarL/FixJ family response regulator
MSLRSRIPARNGTPRVLIAEEETLVREAFQLLLEQEFRVVAAVPDFDSLCSVTARLRPDVVVASMPVFGRRARGAGRAFRAAAPDAQLVLVAREAANGGALAAALGASGWVRRSSTAAELVAAVRAAHRRLPASPPAPSPAAVASPIAVTPRAAEVVRLIARGKAMKAVAADLGISVRTVAFHKYKTMRELSLDSTAALVRYAVRNHLV